MKNRILTAILSLFVANNVVSSAEIPIAPSNPSYKTPAQSTPQLVAEPRREQVFTKFEDCVQTFDTTVENLFFLTLAAINANNYTIDEIQSRTGYITFEANKKMFLASTTLESKTSSMIKITPMDNNYSFDPTIIEKIFAYLETNSQ